jgi:hypothetical protein
LIPSANGANVDPEKLRDIPRVGVAEVGQQIRPGRQMAGEFDEHCSTLPNSSGGGFLNCALFQLFTSMHDDAERGKGQGWRVAHL